MNFSLHVLNVLKLQCYVVQLAIFTFSRDVCCMFITLRMGMFVIWSSSDPAVEVFSITGSLIHILAVNLLALTNVGLVSSSSYGSYALCTFAGPRIRVHYHKCMDILVR